MFYSKSFKNINGSNELVYFEDPSECPMCKASIDPVFVGGYIDNPQASFSAMYHCKHCHNSFIARYSFEGFRDPKNGTQYFRLVAGQYYHNSAIIETVPNEYKPESFPTEVEKLSPRFSKIYNQASQAESLKLDELCGIGYRKALEFLVKDYSIHKHPEDEAKIARIRLKECIDTYIESKQIRILAEVSSFIGNDETHFVKKDDWGTITEMKGFIHAITLYIAAELKVEAVTELLESHFSQSEN